MDPSAVNNGIDERIECARQVMSSAAGLSLHYFQNIEGLTVSEKAPQSLVSEADLETESLIRSALLSNFPEDGWVGEELGNEPSAPTGGTWVVDPIDGTQPFLLGLPTWCVSVAYVLDGKIALGFITKPASGEIFEARSGAGATLNGTPIRVAEANGIHEGITGIGCSSRDGDVLPGIVSGILGRGGVFRQTGSGACDLTHVATGQYVGVANQSLRSWDCLAALCIISEAGGMVTDFVAQHGIEGYGPVVASAPGVFWPLREVIEEAFAYAGRPEPFP